MMVLVHSEIGMHQVCCFPPTYDRAHEPIRKSLIRLDLSAGADAERANETSGNTSAFAAHVSGKNKKAHISLQLLLQCHTASLMPLC